LDTDKEEKCNEARAWDKRRGSSGKIPRCGWDGNSDTEEENESDGEDAGSIVLLG
jgi:hypothetical protein